MYLGDSTPLILRGGGAYNKPETAVPYTPPSSPEVPLILQGGSRYNYPEIYGSPAGSPTYTPPARARKDASAILLVIAAATAFTLLGVGGKGRYLW